MRSTLFPFALLACCFIGAKAQVNHALLDVNPFIGTGGHGHTFPGACVPNGLVQLSPDTRPDGYLDWDGCGGYHYSDSVIHGFSHTHLSGTGVADLCDVLLMPGSGNPATMTGGGNAAWKSGFLHANEAAHAGYYRVHLDRPNMDVELTATARAGVHRYTWPKDVERMVLLDLEHRDQVLDGGLQVVSQTEIVGERRSSSWAKDQRLFFCIRTSERFFPAVGGEAKLDRASAVAGKKKTQVLLFGKSKGEPLIIKVGISAVSIEGARANLDAEVPGWEFDAVRAQAEAAWNAKLSKVEVTGGSRAQQRIFYTALYHCYVAPYVFNDVDGHYRGMDGEVHHADHNVYTVFSLWDTFRALHPLMTILEPEMTNDFIKTFLLHYQQGGRLPVWELWGNETDCMIGYHSVSVIADAYMKGIRGYDAKLALDAMEASAMRDEPGLNAYRAKGYISSEDCSESVSKTLEYAYDDWCIGKMAREMGEAGKANYYEWRSGSGNNLLDVDDDTNIFYRARRNGGFIDPFDPYEVNFHYTEANAWQYSQFAPHGGHIGLHHLDRLFSASSATTGREQADITGLIGQYAHGNEPSHHMAYLYDHLRYPAKTRALVKRILNEEYRDAPDGLSGNEDCGQMSAWYVMSALGIYQVCPGKPYYDIGYPLFDKAQVSLPGGGSWSMVVDSNGTLAPKKPSQGEFREFTPSSLKHRDVLEGKNIIVQADRQPYPQWEALEPGEMNFPPVVMEEAADECERHGAPLILAKSAAFVDSLVVRVSGCGKCTVDEGTGTLRYCRTQVPFTIHNSAVVSVSWHPKLEPVVARFTKIEGGRSLKLESAYANQYAAGGDQALIDGLRGGTDFRTGEWQGYQGQDVLATVDLGKVRKLKRAGISVLQDENAWIWYPASITIAWSANGRMWSSTEVTNAVDRRATGGQVQELWSTVIGKKARYVKVIARSAGPCPEWHKGKGGATWIFADEILIEAE